jgi:hypothetical protein
MTFEKVIGYRYEIHVRYTDSTSEVFPHVISRDIGVDQQVQYEEAAGIVKFYQSDDENWAEDARIYHLRLQVIPLASIQCLTVHAYVADLTPKEEIDEGEGRDQGQ